MPNNQIKQTKSKRPKHSTKVKRAQTQYKTIKTNCAQTGCVELLLGTFVFARVTNSSQTVPRLQVLLLGSLKWILAAQRHKVRPCRFGQLRLQRVRVAQVSADSEGPCPVHDESLGLCPPGLCAEGLGVRLQHWFPRWWRDAATSCGHQSHPTGPGNLLARWPLEAHSPGWWWGCCCSAGISDLRGD